MGRIFARGGLSVGFEEIFRAVSLTFGLGIGIRRIAS